MNPIPVGLLQDSRISSNRHLVRRCASCWLQPQSQRSDLELNSKSEKASIVPGGEVLDRLRSDTIAVNGIDSDTGIRLAGS